MLRPGRVDGRCRLEEVDQFEHDGFQHPRIRQRVAIGSLGGERNGSADLPAQKKRRHERGLKAVLVQMFVIQKPTLGRSQVMVDAGFTVPDCPAGRRCIERQAMARL